MHNHLNFTYNSKNNVNSLISNEEIFAHDLAHELVHELIHEPCLALYLTVNETVSMPFRLFFLF